MRITLIFALGTFLAFAIAPSVTAAETKANPESQLKELVGKVRSKLGQGNPTEETLADELKQFEALLEEHKGDKSEGVARILYMKAALYNEVLKDEKKGIGLLERLQKEFPDTTAAKNAAQTIASMKKQAELAEGKMFPDFQEKDLDGEPLSIAGHKGKVVLVDFWATWCGPCKAELPNVIAAYKKHHERGFEIIGVSLDKERDQLVGYMKGAGITWKQYFDGQGWQTKLAREYGVNSIPATFLLDRKGKIIARNLRGSALDEAVAKALEAKD